MRLISILLLLIACASYSAAATTNNTIDLTGVTVLRNAIPATFTTTSQTDTVNVICGTQPVLAELVGTQDWSYIDPVSLKAKTVTANTPIRLKFYGNMTFKVTRVTADGVVNFQILDLIK